jgi:hypothetical protein
LKRIHSASLLPLLLTLQPLSVAVVMVSSQKIDQVAVVLVAVAVAEAVPECY